MRNDRLILQNSMRIKGIKSVLFVLFFFSSQLFALETINMENYKLGSGDRIQINVFDEEELSLEILLGDTGIVNYPFLGELKLTGLSIKEIEAKITTGLKPDYLLHPSVQISVIE